MEELKIQDGGCSPFLCCSRECASLSVALRLLFTQTDGSVFALEAASPSNWLSLSPQVAEEAVQVCVCEGLVSFSVWARSLSHTARWLRLFKVCQRLDGALVSVWANNITYNWLPSSLVVDRWICTQELQRKTHAECIYTLDYNCILCILRWPSVLAKRDWTPYILSRRSLSTMIKQSKEVITSQITSVLDRELNAKPQNFQVIVKHWKKKLKA